MDLGSISLWPPSSFIGLSPPWTSPRNVYSGLLSLDLTTRSRTLFTASLRNVHSFESDHAIIGPSIISLLLQTSPPLHEDSPLLDIYRRLEPTAKLQETSRRLSYLVDIFYLRIASTPAASLFRVDSNTRSSSVRHGRNARSSTTHRGIAPGPQLYLSRFRILYYTVHVSFEGTDGQELHCTPDAVVLCSFCPSRMPCST